MHAVWSLELCCLRCGARHPCPSLPYHPRQGAWEAACLRGNSLDSVCKARGVGGNVLQLLGMQVAVLPGHRAPTRHQRGRCRGAAEAPRRLGGWAPAPATAARSPQSLHPLGGGRPPGCSWALGWPVLAHYSPALGCGYSPSTRTPCNEQGGSTRTFVSPGRCYKLSVAPPAGCFGGRGQTGARQTCSQYAQNPRRFSCFFLFLFKFNLAKM